MSRSRRLALAALAVLGVGALATLGVRRVAGIEPAIRSVPLGCEEEAPVLPVGEPITLLVWNVQYGASRAHRFFYDGGQAVGVPREDVEATTAAIADAIAAVDADLVLLQEVDRGSRRTHHIDQHQRILERLDPACEATAPYHRSPYVPHPAHEHLGRVDMHLTTLSRYRTVEATRHQLPLLRESFVRRLFNLRRAILETRLPLSDGSELVLLNTHLSAFSKGDGTLGRQVAMLDAHAAAAEEAGAAWVLAGDLNALPPGDDAARLGEDAVLYAEDETPVQVLFDAWASAASAEAYRTRPEELRTYLPYGATAPDRTLDYVFHGGRIRPLGFEVLQQEAPLSDHLPLVFRFVIQPR